MTGSFDFSDRFAASRRVLVLNPLHPITPMIYTELTSPEIGRRAPRAVALLPIAAVEQHGRHLPVQTDTTLATEIARRTELALPRLVALLPTLWAGCSHHHLGFPGTVSLSTETYIRVLVEMVECIARAGFRRIVLLNGHGGNVNPANEALYRLNQKWQGTREPWVALATYWHVAGRELASQKFMKTRRLTHACEYETSMMLAVRPDWVKMRLARGENQTRGSKFYDPTNEFAGSRVAVAESFHQLTRTGAMGSPELATAAKGRQLLDLIAPVMVAFVRDFSRWKWPRS